MTQWRREIADLAHGQSLKAALSPESTTRPELHQYDSLALQVKKQKWNYMFVFNLFFISVGFSVFHFHT